MRQIIEQIIAKSQDMVAKEPLIDAWGVPRPDPAPSWSTTTHTHLPSLLGSPPARLTGKIAEFYSTIDGCTCIMPRVRWCSVAEMADPVASVWNDVSRFDPLANRSAADKAAILKRARTPFVDEIWHILDALGQEPGMPGREPGDKIPDGAALVLFGYELGELAHHATYLYFEDATGSEPVVYSAWDEVGLQCYQIDRYLAETLASLLTID